jgi:antirestriction protein
MNTKDIKPRIYVASLADYNAGNLHGRWIDASNGEKHVRDEIAVMLSESHEPIAEDWAIHDYEGFAGLGLSEFEDIEKVAAVAALIEEHGGVFAKLLEHFGGLSSGLEEASEYIENAYFGEFSSVASYAEFFITEECYKQEINALPEFIRYHIDYEAIGNDLELGGDIFTIEDGGWIHVFAGQL